MADTDLPEDLARLWRRPTGSGSRMGRPAALDVDRVVRTAVALADRQGLAGVTLPKLGEELGVTGMSLYRYVGSKDELLILMGDTAFATEYIGVDAVESWQEGIQQWARGLWQAYQAHRWLADLPTSGPPRGPNAIAWMDAGLRAMRPLPLDPMTKVGILTLVSGYVNTSARMAQQLEQTWRQSGRIDPAVAAQQYGREMAQLATPDLYPDASQIFSSGTFESNAAPATTTPTAPAEANFIFGLEVLIRGIEATTFLNAAEG
ncbi:TetR/AcrR family transcriptional regulator [Nocardia sp. CDC160]|uniref:TetR/AcrR family transcriptional regulator n=1 Tax=Nocardia sp. CDC160 TaxID=3112166 RepID=UPI002DBECD16|nr:TetR/AcrR family transcriptional regulator [Nocardia sp. CDC160]MEC3914856.1 TetR/AcrR family transcriptional regulator [Nocardia sp. CDC160]